jgi:FkbM family methyltransferase
VRADIQAGGLITKLRHQAAPLLPAFLRRMAGRWVRAIEMRRGALYQIGERKLRFTAHSIPTVLTSASDERDRIDAAQIAAFMNAIRPGDTVADVGAFRGTYTVIAAALAGPTGRVVAFEPTAANANVIRTNLALNDLAARVHIEPAAVSDRMGTAEFFVWGDASTNALTRQHDASAGIHVRTVALDEYFARSLPGVLKMDIEGAEILALRGAKRLLASPAVILCELHPYAWPEFGTDAAELRALLHDHGRYAADIITGEPVQDYLYGAVLLKPNSL